MTSAGGASARTTQGAVEWPTLLLLLATYAAFLTLTYFHTLVPWWAMIFLGGYLIALHGSLQHEALHGHPTRWQGLNELLVMPSLWLFMPYQVYRDHHLRHHHDEHLTDPLEDPESYYVMPEAWNAMTPAGRFLLGLRRSFFGRITAGMVISVLRFWHATLKELAAGDLVLWRQWLVHGVFCLPVLFWLNFVEIPLWYYVLVIAMPGVSFTMIRSFLEHRARPQVKERIVIIEAEWPLALMFLNNSLHALHHERPGVAWYRLPALYRTEKARLLQENGGYFFQGYREVVARFAFTPKEPVAWPLATERALPQGQIEPAPLA